MSRLSIPSGLDAIDATLREMTAAAERRDATLHFLALTLVWEVAGRANQMQAFVDELHRRFMYAPDPLKEQIELHTPFEPGERIDVDEACLFVAALASHVGIPVRLIAARVKRSWTLFVAYQDEEGLWTGVDVLRHSNVPPIEEIRS